MSDRMTNPQGPIRSPGGGPPPSGMAYGAAGTSRGRLPSGVRPPAASGTMRGRPAGAPPRYGPVAGPMPQAPVAPRTRPHRGSPIIAPVLALLGLVLIGGVSVWGISVLNVSGAAPESTPDPLFAVVPGSSSDPAESIDPSFPPDEVPEATIAPVLVTPPPNERAEVDGTILYTFNGNIYAASGLDIKQLTFDKSDSGATWSPDGKHIYFVRTKVKSTNQTREKGKYTFYIPNLMRMDADGKKRKVVYDSLITGRGGQWFTTLLQPDVSPDGKTIALVSDGPNGSGPVVLYTLSSKGGKLHKVGARTFGDLGDNDPAWSPDGRMIAFTHNRRQGDDGAPAVTIYNRRTGKAKALKTGYAHPSWSPDGKWLAAELTTGSGRDIVILDAARGDELARLTTDGNSFGPVVSPSGDQVAYLHRDALKIDLRLATLKVDDAGRISLVDDRPITANGQIDAGSSPSWYLPADEQLPVDGNTTASDSLEASTADGETTAQAAP